MRAVPVVVLIVLFASPAVAAAPQPLLLRFSAPAEIECCKSSPGDEDDFSYRLNPYARRVAIAIQRRRCVGCRWREIGRFYARPPHPPQMPTRLYRKLRVGRYRAWARAERGEQVSRRQYRRFRVVRPTHDGRRR